MNETPRLFLGLGAVLLAAAVTLGAFGAHALRERLSAADLDIWQTAVQYHLVHALGLLAIGLVAQQLPTAPLVRLAGWLLVIGIALFSGSLYVLVLSGLRWLGAVTPLGGTAFIAGWLLLAWGVWKG